MLSNTTNVTTQWLTAGYLAINRSEMTANARPRQPLKTHPTHAVPLNGLIRQD
jgi:hypothetical protein